SFLEDLIAVLDAQMRIETHDRVQMNGSRAKVVQDPRELIDGAGGPDPQECGGFRVIQLPSTILEERAEASIDRQAPSIDLGKMLDDIRDTGSLVRSQRIEPREEFVIGQGS